MESLIQRSSGHGRKVYRKTQPGEMSPSRGEPPGHPLRPVAHYMEEQYFQPLD